MRILFFLLFFLSSLTAQALSRPQLETLLKEKGVKLVEMELQGLKVIMGEVTGHIPFSKVQILVTDNEAILKEEIDSVDFNGSQNFGSVISVRFNGQYVMKKDVKAVLVL
jgi:hypothetical protein